MIYDFCVIGGGIVGLAVAKSLMESRPGCSILLIEKEQGYAHHQTGHNSGVIHAGIYYEPGSLKARLCRDGLEATVTYCKDNDIPFLQCGKLIVATNDLEVGRIAQLHDRAASNGVTLDRLGAEELSEREPNIRGQAALFSPKTGIVDYRRLATTMAKSLEKYGASLRLGQAVKSIRESSNLVEVVTAGETLQARHLVVCAGAQSDRLARLAGLEVNFRVIPFRGEYYRLPPSRNNLISHLIYPAPDPSLPFLGVHLTRMIDGSITVGPNAVLGFAREGYPKWSVNWSDLSEIMFYPGFWKMILRHRRHAMHELATSMSRSSYLADCRRYCEELQISDLQPHAAGIRAQVVMGDGAAVHDFLFLETDRTIHVCNAPSPAATSAIPIGRMVAKKIMALAE